MLRYSEGREGVFFSTLANPKVYFTIIVYLSKCTLSNVSYRLHIRTIVIIVVA